MNEVAVVPPVEVSKIKWFAFHQNNSGGSFVVDENVSEYVFVQAMSAAAAIRIAEVFCDNSDSCPCCGDRWSFWVDDSDGADMPMIYGKPYTEHESMWIKDGFARLHYFDGRVETYPAVETLAIAAE